jgi:hypothetical protein
MRRPLKPGQSEAGEAAPKARFNISASFRSEGSSALRPDHMPMPSIRDFAVHLGKFVRGYYKDAGKDCQRVLLTFLRTDVSPEHRQRYRRFVAEPGYLHQLSRDRKGRLYVFVHLRGDILPACARQRSSSAQQFHLPSGGI